MKTYGVIAGIPPIRSNLYIKAANAWGIDSQILIAIEELSELITALLHYQRDKINMDKLIEEIADTMLIIESLRTLFLTRQTSEILNNKFEESLNNLRRMLEGESDAGKNNG